MSIHTNQGLYITFCWYPNIKRLNNDFINEGDGTQILYEHVTTI